MKMRMTRRGCGLAIGLCLTWGANPAARADEESGLPLRPTAPTLLELEAGEILNSGASTIPTERIQDRYANRMLKAERTVGQDDQGNYFNHGPYTSWDEDGRMSGRGEYRFNERHGKWTRWFSTAETESAYATALDLGFAAPFTAQAEFVDGRLHGTWTIVDARKRPVAAWEFENGERHGISIWWYADGRKFREAEFRYGDLDGMVRQWSTDQHLTKEDRYLEGYRFGTKVEYYDSGELKSECQMLFAKQNTIAVDDWWAGTTEVRNDGVIGTDQRHGKYQAWDREGNLILSGTYVDDLPSGQFTWWFSNGNKAIEGTYVAGKQDGLWTWWHANGLKEISGEYVVGNEAGNWKMWSDDGRVAETLQILRNDVAAQPATFTQQPTPPAPTTVSEPATPTVNNAPPAAASPLRRVSFDEATFGDAAFAEEAAAEVAQENDAAPKPSKPVLKIASPLAD